MRRNLILLAALLIVAVAAFSDTPNFSPRDPGTARKDASNITAATWRTALGLGSMATASADDYYTKTEIDASLGSISAALDEIIGAP